MPIYDVGFVISVTQSYKVSSSRLKKIRASVENTIKVIITTMLSPQVSLVAAGVEFPLHETEEVSVVDDARPSFHCLSKVALEHCLVGVRVVPVGVRSKQELVGVPLAEITADVADISANPVNLIGYVHTSTLGLEFYVEVVRL
jgi:hypothetical protein